MKNKIKSEQMSYQANSIMKLREQTNETENARIGANPRICCECVIRIRAIRNDVNYRFIKCAKRIQPNDSCNVMVIGTFDAVFLLIHFTSFHFAPLF
jgi:hypothetical protein